MTINATPSRRQFLSSAAAATGAAGAVVLGLRSGLAGAVNRPPGIGTAASATEPAERISLRPPEPGEILLPVDVSGGGLICLNNFEGFSNARGACGHRGTDIGENEVNEPGRPLIACVDGEIERDGFLSSAGNFRILRGDDGRWYRYHHLDELAADVAEGDRVTTGEVIGTMGRTGNTQWTHLHFEVWEDSVIPRDGTAIDPVSLIEFPLTDIVLNDPAGCNAD